MEMVRRQPGSVLFACTRNAVRSPMAEAIAKDLAGRRLFVDSAGVYPGEVNTFAVAVMDELGLDIRLHSSKTLADLAGNSFDLIVALSTEARDLAAALTRTDATEIEYWDIADPTLSGGTREQRLTDFRAVRDELRARILSRFPPPKEK